MDEERRLSAVPDEPARLGLAPSPPVVSPRARKVKPGIGGATGVEALHQVIAVVAVHHEAVGVLFQSVDAARGWCAERGIEEPVLMRVMGRDAAEDARAGHAALPDQLRFAKVAFRPEVWHVRSEVTAKTLCDRDAETPDAYWALDVTPQNVIGYIDAICPACVSVFSDTRGKA